MDSHQEPGYTQVALNLNLAVWRLDRFPLSHKNREIKFPNQSRPPTEDCLLRTFQDVTPFPNLRPQVEENREEANDSWRSQFCVKPS